MPIGTRRLLGLLLVGLLGACSTSPTPTPSHAPAPSSGSHPPSAASPTASLAPTPADGDVWTLAGFGDEASSTQVRSVIDVADGFIAVGSAGQAGEVAMAWHSTDGRTWEAETITGRGTSPASVVRWGDRLIALGRGQSPRCAHPDEIDVWVREPDGTWTEAPFDPLFCAGGSLTPVIFDDRPWLIGDGSGDVPVLMDSDDALTWSNHRDRVGDVFLWHAAVDRIGLWVIARSVAGDDWLALHSSDGIRWTAGPVGPAGARIADVFATAVVNDRLVLLATTDAGIVRMAPGDAGVWETRAVTGLAGPNLAVVANVGGDVLGILAHDDGSNDLWVSRDGTAWRPIVRPAEAGSGSTLLDVAVHDDVAVLVGQVEAPGGTGAIGAVWTAPATILAP